MRFSVEPSPAGGYFVRLAGVDAPVSRHDTEDEAHAAAATYRRGAEENRVGDVVRLRDGGEVLVRAVQPEDKPLFARGWERFADESRYRRFMGSKARLTTSELSFFTELDHIDHEALGAIDPETGEGLGVARYVRDPERPHAAEAAVSVIDAMQGRGLGGVLLRRLCHRAAQNGIRTFTAGLLTTQPQHAAAVREARRRSASPAATGRRSTSTSSCRSPTPRRSSWRCAAPPPATSAAATAAHRLPPHAGAELGRGR